MTTTDTNLDLRIKTFKASSSFTPGDLCSFSIDFGDGVTLPGKYDPSEYLENLGVSIEGKNVLVVCPGNAGLAVAALRAGASTVVVVEPRRVYHRSLPEVSAFANEIIGATFSHRDADADLVETFDIVFWTEGLDEVVHPKDLVKKVLASMATGSTLYIEVNHGHSGKLPESINCWRPTQAALHETLDELGEFEVITEMEGRSQTRKIYEIKNNTVRVEALDGPDYQSVDDVDDFSKKIRELDQKSQSSVEDFAAAATTKEKVAALDSAITAGAEAVKTLQSARILPTASAKVKALAAKITKIIKPTGEEGEFDMIYEGRASTPKSKKKKKKRSKG